MYNAHRKNARPTGASIPTVMMVVALMMMLGFTVVAIAFNHLNLTFRNSNNTKAELLAEAVLSLAIEKAAKDVENFGVTNDGTVELTLEAYPGGKGILTFNKDQAAALGVPYSTNNRSESPVQSSSVNHGVPGQSLHLVARAEMNGAFSTMETIVRIPKFPYSIASGGAIKSNGGLLVASLKPGVAYDLSLPIHEQDLEPGNLASNSESGETAVEMTGNNTIMGDLRSASGAKIEGDTKVFGKVRRYAGKVDLPQLRAHDYDPRGSAPDGPQNGPPDPGDIQPVYSGAGTLSVKGYNVSDGDLTVDNGINLNGGVLFVDGSLTVSAGGIKGKGAVIATGNITVSGGGEATTDNQAALVADGNITLRGTSSSDKAKFAGLIYTRGNLSSENLRLAGVFVAAGENSDVTLRDTELYQVEENAKLELTGPEFQLPAPAVPFQVLDGFEVQASYDVSSLQADLANYRNPNTVAGQPEYLFKFHDGYTGYKTFEFNAAGNPVLVNTTGPDAFTLDGSKLGLKVFGQDVSSAEQAGQILVNRFEAAKGRQASEGEKDVLNGFGKALFNSPQPAVQTARASAEFTSANGRSDVGNGVGSDFRWTIDLGASEVLSEASRMRVVFWARYK